MQLLENAIRLKTFIFTSCICLNVFRKFQMMRATIAFFNSAYFNVPDDCVTLFEFTNFSYHKCMTVVIWMFINKELSLIDYNKINNNMCVYIWNTTVACPCVSSNAIIMHSNLTTYAFLDGFINSKELCIHLQIK